MEVFYAFLLEIDVKSLVCPAAMKGIFIKMIEKM
jgi:hypothetical protein